MALVWDVPVEVCSLVFRERVSILRGTRHSDELGSVLREIVHLPMALVGDVPVEVRAALRDDPPTITAARGECHPNHIIAGRSEVPHLLMTFIGNVSVEEFYCHNDLPPRFATNELTMNLLFHHFCFCDATHHLDVTPKQA